MYDIKVLGDIHLQSILNFFFVHSLLPSFSCIFLFYFFIRRTHLLFSLLLFFRTFFFGMLFLFVSHNFTNFHIYVQDYVTQNSSEKLYCSACCKRTKTLTTTNSHKEHSCRRFFFVFIKYFMKNKKRMFEMISQHNIIRWYIIIMYTARRNRHVFFLMYFPENIYTYIFFLHLNGIYFICCYLVTKRFPF